MVSDDVGNWVRCTSTRSFRSPFQVPPWLVHGGGTCHVEPQDYLINIQESHHDNTKTCYTIVDHYRLHLRILVLQSTLEIYHC